MNRLLATFAAGAALVAGVSTASATTTTPQVFHFGTPTTTDFNTPVTFNLFDSNLGTLTSINIAVSYGISSTVTVVNNASSDSSGTVFAEGYVLYGSTDSAIQAVLDSLIETQTAVVSGSGSTAVTHLPEYTFNLSGNSQGYSLTAGSPQTVPGTPNPGSTASVSSALTSGPSTHFSETDTNTSDFTPFQAAGGGTDNLFADTYTSTFLNNTGGNSAARRCRCRS